MNKTTLISSAAGIALLVASAAPAAAFAEDSGSDSSVTVNASSSVHVSDDGAGEHDGIFVHLPKFPNFDFNASSSERFNNIQQKIQIRMERDQEHEDRKASSTEQRIQHTEDKADNSIDKRIESLTELMARLANIKLLPADVLATIQASLQAEIGQLNTLKGQIGTDASSTATSSLKIDAEAITKANRVFMLVEPKARIAAAASRIKAVATQLASLSTKLQDRITAAQTAGVDVSAAVTAMSDLNAKLADAKTQADAAVTLTANLQADNGDQTVLAANKAALKDARTKLVAAQQDLAAARHDVATIFGTVKGKGGTSVTATTTTTATTTP